jgi:hypothetical protein
MNIANRPHGKLCWIASELNKQGSEQHLEPDGGFATLMTSNAPGRRASRPIHYFVGRP